MPNWLSNQRYRGSCQSLNPFSLVFVAILALVASGCATNDPVDRPSLALGDVDRRLVEVERRLPGFGGLHIDDGDRVVVLIDPQRTDSGTAAKATHVLRDVFGDDLFTLVCHQDIPSTNLVFRETVVQPAEHSITDLIDWRRLAVKSAIKHGGVVSSDLNEAANRIDLGVKSDASIETLTKILIGAGIPSRAFRIAVEAPVEAMSTLEGPGAPPRGSGGRIGSAAMQGCALGFGALHDVPIPDGPILGVVTASHCSEEQYAVDETHLLHSRVSSGNTVHLC